MSACPYCGDDFFVELFEFWPDERTFQIETCCEASHEEQLLELAWHAEHDPRELGRWLEQQLGRPVRQVVADSDAGGSYGNGGICVDFGLELRAIDLKTAKAWIDEHHRHNGAQLSWRWGHARYIGDELVAVCTVGRPVARMLDGAKLVEVTRLCVKSDLPRWVVWNACSMLYGAAAREAKRRGFDRIITYTREDETGGTLEAAGWVRTHRSKLDRRGWDRNARRRGAQRSAPCRKFRHERGLNKRAKRTVRELRRPVGAASRLRWRRPPPDLLRSRCAP